MPSTPRDQEAGASFGSSFTNEFMGVAPGFITAWVCQPVLPNTTSPT